MRGLRRVDLSLPFWWFSATQSLSSCGLVPSFCHLSPPPATTAALSASQMLQPHPWETAEWPCELRPQWHWARKRSGCPCEQSLVTLEQGRWEFFPPTCFFFFFFLLCKSLLLSVIRTDLRRISLWHRVNKKGLCESGGRDVFLRLVHGALQLRMEMVLPGWPGAAAPRRHPESPSSPLGPARHAQGWFPVGALALWKAS